MIENLLQSPLIAKLPYADQYDPELLHVIPRLNKRKEIGIEQDLPFTGFDVWNAYELSWLNAKGKPEVAIAEFIIPCESKNIIESKSLKLYLNSFNNTRFSSMEDVIDIMNEDLSEACGMAVLVKVERVRQKQLEPTQKFLGICLDELDVECKAYQVASDLLFTEQESVEESVFSDLLKSNCLVTHQPDWGSLQINYSGRKINHEGLLKYIVSFRNHYEFHEQCVERIFQDILTICKPKQLLVEARYTRRGGLDINPIRSNSKMAVPKISRLVRQ